MPKGRPRPCTAGPCSCAPAHRAARPASLDDRLFDTFDARLTARDPAPVVLALSGGGDSMALLSLATAWARARGRTILALTVDHGLSEASADWSRRARAAAESLGARWQGLVWSDPTTGSGVSARARIARHRLIADATREAGARVVLLAHTADDRAEADWMRARGSTLGRLRDWSPSPVWPEGRGLMLMRPLLNTRRETLRDHLRTEGLDWIEDPANGDPRFARARARAALAGAGPAGQGTPPPDPVLLFDPLETDETGVIAAARDVSAATLAVMLTVAGGGEAPPRGERLAGLRARLAQKDDLDATLGGARLQARGDRIVAAREANDRRGRHPPVLGLEPGVETVWDGRFVVRVYQPGWRIGPAGGMRAALSDVDRTRLNGIPALARAAQPVLFRDGMDAPILAWGRDEVRSLVPERVRLATGEATHEDDLVEHAMA